jgi:hypothetical protein
MLQYPDIAAQTITVLQHTNPHKQQQHLVDCLTLSLYTQGAVTARCWLTARMITGAAPVWITSLPVKAAQVKHTCRAHTEGVADDRRFQVFTPPGQNMPTCDSSGRHNINSTVQLFRQRGHCPNRQDKQHWQVQASSDHQPYIRKACLPRLQSLTATPPPHNLAPAEDNCYRAEGRQMVRVQLTS